MGQMFCKKRCLSSRGHELYQRPATAVAVFCPEVGNDGQVCPFFITVRAFTPRVEPLVVLELGRGTVMSVHGTEKD